MFFGEFLTRLTIWLALAGYAFGTVFLLRSPGSTRARLVWTFGCAFYLVHVSCAFAFFHHWSHEAAYRETARQTRELVGWDWGGGIFVNYFFTFVWLADVLWWWLAPSGFVVPPSGGPPSPTLGGQQNHDAMHARTPDRLKAVLRAPRRSLTITALIHGFFFFMVFNGTIVFGRGPVRWYGAAICAAVAFLWARYFGKRSAAK